MVAGEERHDERAKGGGNTLRHTFVKERKEDEERENAQKNQVEIVTGLKAECLADKTNYCSGPRIVGGLLVQSHRHRR